MQLANKKQIVKTTIFLVLILFQRAYATSKSKFKFLFNFYSQDSDGGDQIYGNNNKESTDVIEPMLFIEYKIDANTSIDAHIVYDTWTAASDKELDGNTGASGEGVGRQGRGSGTFGITKDNKTWKWSSRIGISSEFDYKSLNFGGSLEGHFAEDNFVLAISPQIFLDKAKNFDYQNEQVTDFKSRSIISVGINGSQILTASDLLQVGYTFINMKGNLDSISNSIKVADNPYSNSLSRVEERMPGKRVRHALSTKLVHGFTEETAMHIGYRYYTDDWKLDSHTADTSLRMSFQDDEVFLMLSYRFYAQSKVEHWYKEVPTALPVMTSDSDLAKFSSNRVGLHFSKLLGDKNIWGFELEEWDLSSAAYYYTRSNDLSYLIVQVGISCEF